MRSIRLLAVALATPLLSVTATSPLSDVIALPEFKVFEDRPLPAREKWDYVRVGNFEILSNTSTRVTQEFARDLGDFQTVLALIAPHMLIRAEQPVMIVLCGRDDAFARFAVKSNVRSTRGRGTSLVRDAEIASIVVDYETRSSPAPLLHGPGRPGVEDWLSGPEVHNSEEFIRQYIHLSLSQRHPRPPAWAAEGLARIYASLDYNNKWIEIGQPKAFLDEVTVSPTLSNTGFPLGSFSASNSSNESYYGSNDRTGSTKGNLTNSAVNPGIGYTYSTPLVMMPLETMFAVDYDSAQFRGSSPGEDFSLRSWQKQSTAFVHLCLYGEQGKYRKAFLKFSARAATESVTEKLFQECFGLSYPEMALRIRSYAEFTNYTGTIIEARQGRTLLTPRPAAVVRAASDAEVGRIKGETLRLAGQEEAARREFVVAYLRGERDPELLASLGLMAQQRHDATRARTYLEAVAVASQTVPRPRAYLELARARAAAFDAAHGPCPFEANELNALLTPLFAAQRLPQQLVAVYLEIATVWERSAITPARENLAALEYGVRLFPQNGELILRTAGLLLKHGFKADAAALIRPSLETTRDPAMKERLELLQKKLDLPVRVSTTPAASPAARPPATVGS